MLKKNGPQLSHFLLIYNQSSATCVQRSTAARVNWCVDFAPTRGHKNVTKYF